jgi:hypothetical protein
MAETNSVTAEAPGTEFDFPLPKYRTGQTVYCARVTSERQTLPCPDCLGAQKWKVLTPAGSELTGDCLRCGSYSEIRGVPSLHRNVWKPAVQPLTIGSLEIQTGRHYREPISYMAVETGLGSGSVYPESQLYADEAAAQSVAEAKAAAENAKLDGLPGRIEQYNFSRLPITDAAIKAAGDAVWNAWYRLNSLVETIKEKLDDEGVTPTDFRDEVSSEIDFDREYRADRDPFDKLLLAARHATQTTDLPALAEALAALPPFLAAQPAPTATEA